MREAGLPDIRKVFLINAPIAVMWTAVSTSEGLASWWGPNSFTPSIGRPFAVRTAKFGDVRCTLTELRPPEQRLAVVGFDWEPHWHVAFRLKRFNDVTEFKLIHSGWNAVPTVPSDPAPQVMRDAIEGWWDTWMQNLLPRM